MKKILKISSAVLVLLLFFLLVLGNVFYRQLRALIDPTYVLVQIDDELLEIVMEDAYSDYYFSVFSTEESYHPYEKVQISAKLMEKDGLAVPESAVIELKFYDEDGNLLQNIRGENKQEMVYNALQTAWTGYWYPADPSYSGVVRVTATAHPDTPTEELIAVDTFALLSKPAEFSVEKGLCILGIDSKERISLRSILSTDNQEDDWNSLPDWVSEMSADGLFMLGGITKTFDENVSLDSPWDKDKISESQSMAEKIRGVGGEFGVWIQMLELEGTYLEKMGYEPSYLYSASGYTASENIVSLLDENRIKQLKRVFRTFMNDGSVSYVGFSSLFEDEDQHFELLGRFAEECQVAVPLGWSDMSFEEQYDEMGWQLLDNSFREEFYLWKSYAISEYLSEIIEEVGHEKPVFYYTTQDELENVPNLLDVLFNSGVDFAVLNLSFDYENLETALEEIRANDGITRFADRIVVSYEIDYESASVEGYEQSAIENYVQANLALAKGLSEDFNAQGIFINDIYEAMTGKRGPYVSYEWMLGIARTVFEYQKMNGNFPVEVQASLSLQQNEDETFDVLFKIENVGTKDLQNLKLSFLPVRDAETNTVYFEEIDELLAGEVTYLNMPVWFETARTQLVGKKYFIGYELSWKTPSSELYDHSSLMNFISVAEDDMELFSSPLEDETVELTEAE